MTLRGEGGTFGDSFVVETIVRHFVVKVSAFDIHLWRLSHGEGATFSDSFVEAILIIRGEGARV